MGRPFIPKEDVSESFVRSSGPGGQNVNKVATCVQLVHLPTGMVVKCQQYRTQSQNRAGAWDLLSKALEEKQQKEADRKRQAAEKHRRQNRKPSKAAKNRMVEHKRKHSLKKQNRRGAGKDE